MEVLIEAVRKHSILWDLSNKNYKDNKKKNEAWKTVAQDCELTEGNM